MLDQLPSQQAQTATEDRAASLEQPRKTVVDNLLSMQALQLEVAQSFWRSWMELLALPWSLSLRQQETFQKLLETPMQPYVDWMLAPLRLSRQLVETSMTAMQCEREHERVP